MITMLSKLTVAAKSRQWSVMTGGGYRNEEYNINIHCRLRKVVQGYVLYWISRNVFCDQVQPRD